MTCASCRRDIADGSNFCPYCGTTQTPPSAGAVTPGSSVAPEVSADAMGGVRSTPALSSGTFSQGGAAGGAPVPGPSQRATTVLVLGIASLAVDFFCGWCYGLGGLLGIGLGLTAFVMGRNELEDIAGGFASPAGQANASTGKLLGLIGAIVGGLFFAGFLVLIMIGVAVNLA